MPEKRLFRAPVWSLPLGSKPPQLRSRYQVTSRLVMAPVVVTEIWKTSLRELVEIIPALPAPPPFPMWTTASVPNPGPMSVERLTHSLPPQLDVPITEDE